MIRHFITTLITILAAFCLATLASTASAQINKNVRLSFYPPFEPGFGESQAQRYLMELRTIHTDLQTYQENDSAKANIDRLITGKNEDCLGGDAADCYTTAFMLHALHRKGSYAALEKACSLDFAHGCYGQAMADQWRRIRQAETALAQIFSSSPVAGQQEEIPDPHPSFARACELGHLIACGEAARGQTGEEAKKNYLIACGAGSMTHCNAFYAQYKDEDPDRVYNWSRAICNKPNAFPPSDALSVKQFCEVAEEMEADGYPRPE